MGVLLPLPPLSLSFPFVSSLSSFSSPVSNYLFQYISKHHLPKIPISLIFAVFRLYFSTVILLRLLLLFFLSPCGVLLKNLLFLIILFSSHQYQIIVSSINLCSARLLTLLQRFLLDAVGGKRAKGELECLGSTELKTRTS